MWTIFQSPVSCIHIGFGIIALLSGSWVLLTPKGTVRHRRLGYVYVVSLMVVLTTAFGIYNLFGHFGIVHWGAVGSWAFLLGGMSAVWLRHWLTNWLFWHYVGLSASVAGLYATFLVESTYRFFPEHYFWWSTVGTSVVVFVVAGVLGLRAWPIDGTHTPLPHTLSSSTQTS